MSAREMLTPVASQSKC